MNRSARSARSVRSLRSRTAVALATAGLLGATLTTTAGADNAVGHQPVAGRAVVGPAFFDDLNYSGHTDPLLVQHGWTPRSHQGGPGVPGARWKPRNITFATASGNSVMTLRSGTDGTAAGTEHTELRQQRKFHYGTYAARVRFSDSPVHGPDGDRVVQAFFTITPLNFPMDPDYGELDFEYIPNGGWSIPTSTLLATSWETYQEDPAIEVNVGTQERAGFGGWHDLVITVDSTDITYWIDGRVFATHTEPYVPETAMGIYFNQWLINLGGITSSTPRTYEMKADYVFFAQDVVMTPAQVQSAVADYRTQAVTFHDTV